MSVVNKIPYVTTLFLPFLLHAWEEDPRIAEHNERTSYLLAVIDRQVAEKDPETITLLNFIYEEKEKLMEKKDE